MPLHLHTLPETAYEIAMKTTMNYPWKTYDLPQEFKFSWVLHPWNLCNAMKLLWSGDAFHGPWNNPWYTMNWLSWYISLGWIKFSWKHPYLPGSDSAYHNYKINFECLSCRAICSDKGYLPVQLILANLC